VCTREKINDQKILKKKKERKKNRIFEPLGRAEVAIFGFPPNFFTKKNNVTITFF
jgi:hypothetical protein